MTIDIDAKIRGAADYSPATTKPLVPPTTKPLLKEQPTPDQQQLQGELKPANPVEADLKVQKAQEAPEPKSVADAVVEQIPEHFLPKEGYLLLTKNQPETTQAEHITINFSLEPDPSKPEMGQSAQAFQTPGHDPKDTVYIQPRYTNAFHQQISIKASPDCLYFKPKEGKYVSFLDLEKGQDTTRLFEPGEEIFVLVPTTHDNFVRLRMLGEGSTTTTIEHTGIVTKDQLSQADQKQ